MRGLCAYAGLFIAVSFGAASQEQSAKWFDVPPDKAALVVFADTRQPTTLLASGDGKDLIDKFSWDFGFPLVRQYRLAPGDYQIIVNDDKDAPINAQLKGGQLNFLQISDPKISDQKVAIHPATFEPLRTDVSAIVDELSLKGYYDTFVAPQHLEPKDQILYFNTEPPFSIPKPGDPPPQQN